MFDSTPSWALYETKNKTKNFAGGVPFLNKEENWPVTYENEPLFFLLQINLEEIPDIGLNIPSTGYLQFFHHGGDEDPYGCGLHEHLYRNHTHTPGIKVRHVTNVEEKNTTIPQELSDPDTPSESPLTDYTKKIYYAGQLKTPSILEKEEEEIEEKTHENEVEKNFYDYKTKIIEDFEPEFYLGGKPPFDMREFHEEFGEREDDLVLLLGSYSGKNISWGDNGVGGIWVPSWAIDEREWGEAFLYWQ